MGKATTKPRPRGRPTKYDPAMCERVEKLGAEGMSRAEIAAEIGVVRNTLDNWAAEHPEFLQSLQRASELSLAWWEKQGRTNLTTAGFQASLWKQCMSGRFPAEPYRERVEHTGKDGGPIQSESRATVDFAALSEEQLRVVASLPVNRG